MVEKWAFIINPIAGNGYAEKHVNDVKNNIKKYKIDAEIVLTKYEKHATELSGDFVNSGFSHIVAVGGDGTINEVAQSIIGHNDVTFGAVSAGTGNDFIQILGFSEHFKEIDWNIFFKRNTIKMDVGQCNDHFFLNGMGLGFDAQVAAQNYDENGSKKGGKDKYLYHILKTLLLYREKPMQMKIDDDFEEIVCFMNTIAIGRRFAGEYFLTPKAIANDGMLDVCAIKNLRLLSRLKLFLKASKGTHVLENTVNYFQTKKLEFKFDKKVAYHLDGELFFANNLDVKILPKEINIIYNPDGRHFFNI